jgi:hypothetical protein
MPEFFAKSDIISFGKNGINSENGENDEETEKEELKTKIKRIRPRNYRAGLMNNRNHFVKSSCRIHKD